LAKLAKLNNSKRESWF